MRRARATTREPAGNDRYEIRVQGHLDDRWTASFAGLSLRRDPDGTTMLAGDGIDQAALHGYLRRIRDLGLPLLSVERIGGGHHTDATDDEVGP